MSKHAESVLHFNVLCCLEHRTCALSEHTNTRRHTNEEKQNNLRLNRGHGIGTAQGRMSLRSAPKTALLVYVTHSDDDGAERS